MTAFALSDDLSHELYPLAWLVGSWRGPGLLEYPGLPERGIVVEASFTHDGGPYLIYTATTYLLDGETPRPEDPFTQEGLVNGTIWASESGYWRPTTEPDGGVQALAGASESGPEPTPVEVLLAEPSGHVSVHVGAVQGPRVDLVSDLVARTASAAEVTAQRRMYGLVQGHLFWIQELAAFGHELQHYSAGRLARVDTGA